MKVRSALLALAMVVVATAVSFAQSQTGLIFGRVTDNSGAVIPGATVTVAGPALIQPRVAVSSETGTFRIPELPIGIYSITFELAGFRSTVHADVQVSIGFSAQVNATLELSTVQETVTVSGASPLVDTQETGTGATFDQNALQNIPSGRDPWVMLERTPGITMDRVNVGGSQSGQQSGFVSRGAGGGNTKWSVDGTDVTDMSATGSSPIYYDFDMIEELQVTTGGNDITQQTGGVGINVVMKSGTDRFKGSGRFYLTDESTQADNVTDEARAGGVGAGAPIQRIQDYGAEAGGPIKAGRAWLWGSYGKQDIKVGVVGFYKTTPECRPGGVALNPRTADTDTLRSCLETDLTTLNNYNWKLQAVPFRNNKLTVQNTWAEKVRNSRDASDLRPIETTYRQKSVSSDFGAFGWTTGANPFWKFGDQHVVTDRLLLDVAYAHLGNNFVLDFHEDGLSEVQARFETSTSRWDRSFQASTFLRPTNSVDVLANYFKPGLLGGDHSLKVGYRWRSAHTTSLNHRGGNADARFTNGIANSADLWRDSIAISHLDTHALFAQNTYTRNRLTVNIGLRFDRQDDSSLAADIPGNPLVPTLLPGIAVPDIDAGVEWADLSPRLGVTYDLTGDGRTIVSSSFGMYFGQLAPGQLSGELVGTGAVFVRYPWNDANADTVVQANELNTSTVLSRSAAYDPANPTNFRTPGAVDTNIQSDRTREFIVGFDRQIGSMFALGGSYIWRQYDRFNWRDRVGFGSENNREVNFTPTGCPAGARCESVTYFEPTVPLPSAYVLSNTPGKHRDYNGIEVTLQKRMANRWSANASYAFNDAVDKWDSPAGYEDPTCRSSGTGGYETLGNVGFCQGGLLYAPEAGNSGIDNVFINARWLVKLSGTYQPFWDLNLAASYNGRQGYPFVASVLTPNRANQAGTLQVNLDPAGDSRLPNLHTIDFRIDRTFRFGKTQLRPTLDVFNVTNASTVLAIRRNQAAANANQISGIVAPRILRLGLNVRW
jgi:hypothetical protein